jgi:Mrp family chromosome partitioning ATPase
MSALDKAFVKAYGKVAAGAHGHTVGRSADEPIPAPVVPTPDALGPLRSPNAELPPMKFAASPEVLYRPEWISPSQTASVVPAPHIDFRLAPLPPAAKSPLASRIDAPHVAAAKPLRAAFEVEAFVWPEVVRQMADLPDAAFAPLLAELGELSGRGQKLVAISGCRTGAGATTLLLALAQLLGKRDVSTAVVDLEFWRPQLAEQLGIAPQADWHGVLSGGHPLTEALVESLNDRVTLMPLCETFAADKLADPVQLTDLLRTMSRDFDLVLLNVGPLQVDVSTAGATFDLVAWLGKLQIDFSLLVRDTRQTTHEESLTLGLRLTSAGVKQWHLAENYITAGEAAIEPETRVAPVTPARVAPAQTYSAPVHSVPITSPAAVINIARPVLAGSSMKSNEAAADWQSTVVPPWKT